MTAVSAREKPALVLLRQELNSKFGQDFLRDRRRSAGQRFRAARRLRERDHLADVLLPRQERDEALEAERKASVWGRSHPQHLEKEAEALLGLLVRDPHRAEDPFLQLRVVDPDRARSELPPAQDEVVRLAHRPPRIRLDQLLVAGPDARERVVAERPALTVLVPLEDREIGDPEKLVARLVEQAELAAEMVAHRREDSRDGAGLVGAEEDGGPGRLRSDRLQLILGEELRDRRPDLALLVEDEVREPLPTPLLGQLLERGELRARELLRHGQVLHARGLREHLELRPPRCLRRVVQLQPEAQVGLVGAVARHRLVPGQPAERPHRRLASQRLERRHDRALEGVEDLVARRERELEVELAELELPVGAEVLVPEAESELVVAAEARDHQRLLEQLRRLRQREEAAGLEPHRHDEVARALRGGGGQVRGPDVDEALRVHEAPDRCDHRRGEAQVALHPLAPQVEVAVTEAQAFVHVLLVELEGKRLRARDDLELVDLELDLAGRKVRIDRIRRARGHLALGADDELVPDSVGDLGGLRRALRVDHQLREPALVAKVDEDEPAVVATRGRPARERESLPGVLLAELPRVEITPPHCLSISASPAVVTSSSGCPGRRTVERSGPHSTIARAPSRRAWVSWPLSERAPKPMPGVGWPPSCSISPS